MKPKIIAVDLFCGAGGLTRGLLDAGIGVKKGFDNDFRLKDTYEKNNPGAKFYYKNISELTGKEILKGLKRRNTYLLLAGCAPCQPFSALMNQPEKKHDRINLLLEFGRIISEIKPDFVFAENVPGLKNGKGKKVFKAFENILQQNSYSFISKILDARDYGVPQKRKRLVLLASLHGDIMIPESTHGSADKGKKPYVTVKDTISRFPEITAGYKDKKLPNHETRNLSALNLERLRHIRKDGGTRLDLPEELSLNCHKGHKGHTDVYGRMKWNDVSPTLTCKCTSLSNGRFGHPNQMRAISVREAAALQTFKDDYVFYGSLTDNTKWVGNAVPPLFARCIVGELINNYKRSCTTNGV